MDATIYHNPRCTTSRNALTRLREAGVEPEVVKYLDTGWTREQLTAMFDAAGLTPAQAVRRREKLYKELGLADASDDELLDAMVDHPVLVERPFVVTEKGTRLARPMDRLDEILP
ncbi:MULTISPECIES: arsenate reductase (glutaredoxin) [Gordonia]|uniref:arsenate reductase (glutathione/glutaredoxin) n=2 Tax=Gordonia TaxID=2053 RepID=L7LN21_9ACTN|nr:MULTISPECIES: arsenate reductase (glutaredoxin) [Gordonia]AUH69747.1 arsenate reductase (glutaredoxin) [Gordonia sp. YC-JH1]KJR07590.1 arsenate reductase [Gordonia sihwensis]KXT55722.1 arsenate reductase [Gordonia sp. QH-12]MBY4571433.1 arsenate reductase (glutaredoxin) [Gordonia sihwensis]WFN93662.1 arsenate reductase (glutaredoxin) [Gordonia sihwensis]